MARLTDPATEKIRAVVRDRGIRLSVLARKAAVPVAVLYRALGKRGRQSLRATEFLAICRALEIDPREAFSDDTAMKGANEE